MLEFDKTFFESEVRDGFFVPAMMKRSWATQIKILTEIDRICKKHDIEYFAEWGTLLGVVRHKGIIPWDDDTDICMTRENYLRFIQIANDELRDGCTLYNAYSDLDYSDNMSRIVNTREIRLDDEYLKNNYQFPYSGGVDIFPLDYLARDEEDTKLQKQLMSIITTVEETFEPSDVEWGENSDTVEQIEELCAVKFDKEKPIKQQLVLLRDRIMALYGADETDEITLLPLWQVRPDYKFPKHYYTDPIYMPFENIMMPVPKQYDEILRIKYGEYMTPVKIGSSHDYPYYRKTEEQLIETLGYEFKTYEFPGIYEKTFEKDNDDVSAAETLGHKRTVLFMPFKSSNWEVLKPFYEEEVKRDDTEVIVAPIPYYHCGFKGDILDDFDDMDGYPKNVKVTYAGDINLTEMTPDVIYIQNPCDGYGKDVITHPLFDSDKLAKLTDELIYVPWVVTSDFDETEERSYMNMKEYVEMPGLVYADKIYVQSEIMKETYKKKLVEWAGEDTKDYWERKLLVCNA